jgi:hypothetical protein
LSYGAALLLAFVKLCLSFLMCSVNEVHKINLYWGCREASEIIEHISGKSRTRSSVVD